MNTTINLLKNHRSTRNFVKEYEMPKEHLEEILLATKQAPSWMNGQAYSVIVVTNQKIKDKLFSFTTRNPHIVTSSVFFIFLADFTKQKLATEIEDKPFFIENNEAAFINTTTDTVLAMQNTAIAAESIGYGTVFCGGIRDIAEEVIEIFDLPKYTYPICGLSIGKVDDNIPVERLKPRFPLNVNIGINEYPKATKEDILEYNKTLEEFAEVRETKLWSVKFADVYSVDLKPTTKEILKKQGF